MSTKTSAVEVSKTLKTVKRVATVTQDNNQDSVQVEQPVVIKAARKSKKTAIVLTKVDKSTKDAEDAEVNDSSSNASEMPVVASKTTYEDCMVCCQAMTRVKRKSVCCNYCQYNVCSECIQRYLLSKADAHCMNCKKLWPNEFLRQNFSKVFIKEKLADHHLDVLLELEKSLFPETLIRLEQQSDEQRQRDLYEDATHWTDLAHRFELTKQQITTRASQLYNLVFPVSPDPDYDSLFTHLRNTLTLCNDSLWNHCIDIHKFYITKECQERLSREQIKAYLYLITQKGVSRYNHIWKPWCCATKEACVYFRHIVQIINTDIEARAADAFNAADKIKKDKGTISKPIRCSVSKCPGYLIFSHALNKPLKKTKKSVAVIQLSSNDDHKMEYVGNDDTVKDTDDKEEVERICIGECKVCKTFQCMECMTALQTKTTEHICDEDLVKTIKMIAKSSKPCPNCKQPIMKLHGCNQMFCTECNTAFDWETNQIITGRIHNPHYFIWLSKTGKTAQDNPAQQAQQQQQQQEPEHLCRNETLFTDANHVKLFGRYNYFSRSDAIVEEGVSLVVRNKAFALKSLWQCMVHMLGVIIEPNQTIMREPPVERYRRHRERFLKGTVDLATYRMNMKTAVRAREKATAIGQLGEAVALIANNLFEDLLEDVTKANNEPHLVELYAKQNQPGSNKILQGITNYIHKGLVPLIERAYDQAVEMVIYYNDSARRYAQDQGTLVYCKLFYPAPFYINDPEYINKHMTLSTTVGTMYNDILKKHHFSVCANASLMQNELYYVIDNELTNALAKQSEHADLKANVATNNTEIDNTATESQSVIGTTLSDLSTNELAMQRYTNIVAAHYKQLREACKVLPYTVENTRKAADEMHRMLSSPELANLQQDFARYHDEAKKKRTRLDILRSCMKSIHRTFYEAVTVFTLYTTTIVRELYWNEHTERTIKLIVSSTMRLKWNFRSLHSTACSDYFNALVNNDNTVHGLLNMRVNINERKNRFAVLFHDIPFTTYQVAKNDSHDASDSQEECSDDDEELASSVVNMSSALCNMSLSRQSQTTPQVDLTNERKEEIARHKLKLQQISSMMRELHLVRGTRNLISKSALQIYSKYKAYFFTCTEHLYYWLTPQMNFHTTQSFLDGKVTVKIPCWLQGFLTKGSNFYFDWYKPTLGVGANAFVMLTPLLILYPLCTIYINDMLVSPNEAFMLPYILDEVWTHEDIKALERRLEYVREASDYTCHATGDLRHTASRHTLMWMRCYKFSNAILEDCMRKHFLRQWVQGKFNMYNPMFTDVENADLIKLLMRLAFIKKHPSAEHAIYLCKEAPLLYEMICTLVNFNNKKEDPKTLDPTNKSYIY